MNKFILKKESELSIIVSQYFDVQNSLLNIRYSFKKKFFHKFGADWNRREGVIGW
jgi:hypothetical protein